MKWVCGDFAKLLTYQALKMTAQSHEKIAGKKALFYIWRI